MPSDKPKFQRQQITAARGNGFFEVGIKIDNGIVRKVLCTLSGKMRRRNIKVVEGDYVDVELDPSEMKKGIIVYRHRG